VKKINSIAVLLLLFNFSYGQPKEYNFIKFSSKNGLSSNSVNAIIRDKYGFMWFGTDDGLNKFDGLKFPNTNLRKIKIQALAG
jgi:ligand-binding sensor domain-containing protein